MAPTKAVGVRAEYQAMPSSVQKWLEGELGSPVVSAVTQVGGMSPGVAARLMTSDGQRAFVKAVGSAMNPDSPGMYRNEIATTEHVDGLPWVPRLLSTFDDGDWIALLFEDIDGRQPHHPWTADEVDAVFAALGQLTAALTPTPLDELPVLARTGLFTRSWNTLQSEPPDDLTSWELEHLDELVALVEHAADAVRGDTLAHIDVRADNTLLTPDGRVFFVDWANACLAAPWVDTVIAALDVVISGSDVDVDTLLARHPCTRNTPADDVTALVVTVTGMLAERSRAPEPPGLPTIRSYQRMASAALTAWVKRRVGR